MAYRRIPCENCITYPMCVSEYKSYKSVGYQVFFIFKRLSEKCSIIHNWAKSENMLRAHKVSEWGDYFRDNTCPIKKQLKEREKWNAWIQKDITTTTMS